MTTNPNRPRLVSPVRRRQPLRTRAANRQLDGSDSPAGDCLNCSLYPFFTLPDEIKIWFPSGTIAQPADSVDSFSLAPFGSFRWDYETTNRYGGNAGSVGLASLDGQTLHKEDNWTAFGSYRFGKPGGRCPAWGAFWGSWMVYEYVPWGGVPTGTPPPYCGMTVHSAMETFSDTTFGPQGGVLPPNWRDDPGLRCGDDAGWFTPPQIPDNKWHCGATERFLGVWLYLNHDVQGDAYWDLQILSKNHFTYHIDTLQVLPCSDPSEALTSSVMTPTATEFTGAMGGPNQNNLWGIYGVDTPWEGAGSYWTAEAGCADVTATRISLTPRPLADYKASNRPNLSSMHTHDQDNWVDDPIVELEFV